MTTTAEIPGTSLDGVEDRIVQILRNYSQGISDWDLREKLCGVDGNQRVTVMQGLLDSAKIDLLKSGSTYLYKLKDPTLCEKAKGCSAVETLIYQIIEESGHNGIWIKEIREKSNLSQTQLMKSLKNLESRKLIKSIKSAGSSFRKRYILYGLQPNCSLTGGSFYSEQQLDSQFVELLLDLCRRYLEERAAIGRQSFSIDPLASRKTSLVNCSDLCDHIRQLGISKVDLKEWDVEQLLNTLVFDSFAEKVIGPDGTPLFRSVPPIISVAPQYFKHWLP